MKNEVPILTATSNQHITRDTGRSRLLYLVGQLRLGGLERQLYYLLANLNHARYQPSVVVWNLNLNEKYYREIDALKIPICGFPAEWSSLYKLQAFRALARQLAPEIIHSYSFHTNFAAYFAAWGTSALAIGSLRSDFGTAKKAGGSLRGALNSRWPGCHISNSVACAEGARQHSGPFAPRKLLFVRNGLDLDQFSSFNDTLATRNYVAAVGSLFQVKRWDRLLRIVQKLKDIYAGNIRFRIAGDGPLRGLLEQLAKNLDIAENVEFLGAVHDIRAFLQGAKFLVHTSESEGCPNAVMEAMACGRPVVAMEAGDIPYLVKEGKSGFVVRQDEEAAMANRIMQLLDDDCLCNAMGLAARAIARQEFGLQRMVSQTLDAYRAVGWADEEPKDL